MYLHIILYSIDLMFGGNVNMKLFSKVNSSCISIYIIHKESSGIK